MLTLFVLSELALHSALLNQGLVVSSEISSYSVTSYLLSSLMQRQAEVEKNCPRMKPNCPVYPS